MFTVVCCVFHVKPESLLILLPENPLTPQQPTLVKSALHEFCVHFDAGWRDVQVEK